MSREKGMEMETAIQEKWLKPQPVSKLDLVFGGGMDHLLPKYEEIPDDFKRDYNPWCEWQSKWFFSGLKENEIPVAKEGIDQRVAFLHLKTIQGSFEPQHEHKMAAVAWLASLWFVEPK